MMQINSKILAGLMGVCVGDALGVPVEFCSRKERQKLRVVSMQGYGTHNQPPGTWSDDSSLTFCLAESLCSGGASQFCRGDSIPASNSCIKPITYEPECFALTQQITPNCKTEMLPCSGFNLEAIAQSFCRWYSEGYWTAWGGVFDIGNTTAAAIRRLLNNVPPLQAGSTAESSNGNGSLMRILPLAYYHQSLEFAELIQRVHQVSCLTHAHPRSQMTCGIYISIAIALLQGKSPEEAYLQGVQSVRKIYAQPPYAAEMPHFQRIFSGDLADLPIDSIESSGYAIHTLEASLWCFLNSTSYAEAVLKAVNLGDDTDTTAAVTGGLAGIYYGVDNIPTEWMRQIARKEDIIDLALRLEAAVKY